MKEEELLRRIQELEAENAKLRQAYNPQEHIFEKIDSHFSLEEYRRYGRQMIVSEFGSLPAQKRLKDASILVVGAGGLGCPALLYLGGAGIGKIGIVDNDIVDVSNLHRQVLHTTETVGMLKCESAKLYLNRLNPHVSVATHPERLTNENAFGIISQYDLVLDCTDTPATRYLINDVSVLCGKTIVSGSGVKTDGQITILNFRSEGPCYRCFYPTPPKPESVSTCGDAGVLGPAIGITGIAIAMEAIKVLTGYYDKSFEPFLSMYSAYPMQNMRVFKMRKRQKHCLVCGEAPTITREIVESGKIDYAVFCGSVNSNILTSEQRIDVKEFHSLRSANPNSILIDVRPREQFLITKLPNAINIDWTSILSKIDSVDDYIPLSFNKDEDALYVICRYGNDSQLAAQKLHELGFRKVKDIKGGMYKWSCDVDPKIPIY